MADAKVVVERLNDTNWASWKFRVELLLVKDGLWEVVSNPKPVDVNATWISKDASARAVIGLALDDGQLSHVLGASTANEMWTQLQGYHERGSLSNKIHVLRKLCSLRLMEGGDMSKHLTEMTGLVHKLLGMGEKLAEYWIVAMLLSSLPESYNPLITTLEGRAENELKLDYVKGKLLDEWRRRCEKNEISEDWDDKALKAGMQRRERQQGGNNFRRECYYCHEDGHIRRDCPRLNAGRPIAGEKSRTENEDASDYERGSRWNNGRNVCFTTTTTNFNGTQGWLIDSGSASHMTREMGRLKSIIPCDNRILLADGKRVPVRATGTCEFQGCGANGETIGVKMRNVAYVPELAANIISVIRLVEEGFTVTFGAKDCKICHDNRVILVGEKRGALFYLREPHN